MRGPELGESTVISFNKCENKCYRYFLIILVNLNKYYLEFTVQQTLYSDIYQVQVPVPNRVHRQVEIKVIKNE